MDIVEADRPLGEVTRLLEERSTITAQRNAFWTITVRRLEQAEIGCAAVLRGSPPPLPPHLLRFSCKQPDNFQDRYDDRYYDDYDRRDR